MGIKFGKFSSSVSNGLSDFSSKSRSKSFKNSVRSPDLDSASARSKIKPSAVDFSKPKSQQVGFGASAGLRSSGVKTPSDSPRTVPNFSRPLNQQSGISPSGVKPSAVSVNNGPGKIDNNQAFDFGFSSPYENLNFKTKKQSFADRMTFWRPDSQLNTPSKTSLEPSLQTNQGRVAASLTGQNTQQGVAGGLNKYAQSMQPGESLSLGKHNKTEVAGGTNVGILDMMAPGSTTALNTSGIDFGWGPSAVGQVSGKHDRFNKLDLSRPESGPATLTGAHGHETEAKLKAGARVSAGMGTANGAFIGPSAAGSLEAGVKHNRSHNYNYAGTTPGSQSSAMMDFVNNNGKTSFNGSGWSAADTKTSTTFPAAAKLEGSVGAKAPSYGVQGHGMSHSGSLDASATAGVDDLLHPRTTAYTKTEVGGSLSNSLAGKSFANDEAGAISGLSGRMPQDVKVESHKQSLFPDATVSGKPGEPVSQKQYHSSYVSQPFGYSTHTNRLDDKYGPGTSGRLDQGFKDAFGHEDIPNRRRTVIEKQFDDGRTEIYGKFDASAAHGQTYKVPVVPASYSNYADASIKSNERILFTIPPKVAE